MANRRYEVELFEVNGGQLGTALSGLEAYSCEVSFSPRASSLFPTASDRAFHVARLIEETGVRAVVRDPEDNPNVVALGKIQQRTLQAYHLPGPDYAVNVETSDQVPFDDILGTSFQIVRHLLNKSLRSKVKPPIVAETSLAYDTSVDLAGKIKPQYSAQRLLQPIRVHPGFHYSFRPYRSKLYAQILPQSRIIYSKSLWDLIQSGEAASTVVENFPFFKIAGAWTRRIVELTNMNIDAPIPDEPFNNRSFREFAAQNYSAQRLEGHDIPLIRVVSSNGPSYFPSSWAYPSVTYTGISFLNDGFYSKLVSTLKTQGKNRPIAAKGWIGKLSPLKIGETEIELSNVPRTIEVEETRHDLSDIDRIAIGDIGLQFPSPSISLMRNGEEVEVFPGMMGYQATVNDLMKHPESKPLDVPRDLNLVVFIDSKLQPGWVKVRESLVKGKGDYRGFFQTFGVNVHFEEKEVEDFFSQDFKNQVAALPELGFDCALIIIPRYMSTSDETKRIYVETKTQIMDKGIPVQVFTDDQKITFSRNSTLDGKAENAYTLFGMAINILAKVGTVLTALSKSATSKLVPDSMILGYNIARISPSEPSSAKTIPLAAPLVIFDNKGAYISHQDVYRLKSEISLFEEHGETIMKFIPSDISNLVIHKDGYFTKSELDIIRTVGKTHGVRTLPISIRTGSVPRVFNPGFFGTDVGLKAGTVLPLSDSDFLIVTTPIRQWDPERLGWPNPIHVTLHEPIADPILKTKLLYHIYALTKMQTGSQRAVRTPVSIHFSNMILKFIRKVGEPTPTYLRHFVKRRENGKYLARWFV